MTLRIPTNRIPVDVDNLSAGSSRPAGQSTTAGNGWEVKVLSYTDFHTVLAVIPRVTSVQFSKVLNDKGAGTVTMSLDDPIWSTNLGDGSPGTTLIDFENLWQVWHDGVLVFDFLGETVTEQLVDETEGRQVTITGPGTVACLSWACAMPPGFPNIKFKTDAIQDGFAEVDNNGNPLLDTALWNASSGSHITLNPLGTCQLTGTTAGTFLGASPYDLTESLISAQVTPIPETLADGSTANGSQLSQFIIQDNNGPAYCLFGVSATQFYMQFKHPDGSVTTKNLGNFDSNGDANWQFSYSSGTLFFWTSADGESWVKQWSVDTVWVPNTVTVQFACYYTPAGGKDQVMQITSLNGNVVTPTSAGNIYLNTPCMAVWKMLFDDAQSRGTLKFVGSSFDTTADSFGNRWQDAISQQVTLGTDLYSLLQSFAGIINADYVMQPGFQLQVGLTLAIGTGSMLGNDLSKQIIFREGRDEQTKQRVRARDTIANLIGAVNSDGTVVSDSDSASIATFQQRETWIQTAQQVNSESMAVVAAASLDQLKNETLSWTLTVDPTSHVPFTDYDVGDWVGMERPGVAGNTIDAIRVIGIAISIDAQGLVTCELTLNSYRQWLAEQLLYLVNKFGGQFVNALGTTPVTTNASNPSQLPIAVAPSLGGLTDVTLQ